MSNDKKGLLIPKRTLGLMDIDGHYIVMKDNTPSYEYGSVGCELIRVKVEDIKRHIDASTYFGKPVEGHCLIDAANEIESTMKKEFGLPSAIIILAELCKGIGIVREIRECKDECLSNQIPVDPKRIRAIMKGSGYDNFGTKTVGQLFLSSLVFAGALFDEFCRIFRLAMLSMTDAGNEKLKKTVRKSVFDNSIAYQHIDYKIIDISDEEKGIFGLKNVYGIRSFTSLLIFEFANCLNHNTPIRMCENCGDFFVASGRSDAIYCPYNDSNHPGKTCREIGPQLKRAKKEQLDIPTREYRKIYMRLKMQVKRHPDDVKAKARLDNMTSEAREWRNQLARGECTENQYLEWLSQFE